jgi:hypothetical protein
MTTMTGSTGGASIATRGTFPGGTGAEAGMVRMHRLDLLAALTLALALAFGLRG